MLALGEIHADSFKSDAKHLTFVLARYHFVARMFKGFEFVLEVGCGDCTGAPIVADAVQMWMGIDKKKIVKNRGVHEIDILKNVVRAPFQQEWNGVYALDVLEHIDPEDEEQFFVNINASLDDHGTVIIGSPSLESQSFASEPSRREHINCKSEDGLRATLLRHYQNAFLFGMNDSTLHTGFGPMCHYRLAICTGKK